MRLLRSSLAVAYVILASACGLWPRDVAPIDCEPLTGDVKFELLGGDTTVPTGAPLDLEYDVTVQHVPVDGLLVALVTSPSGPDRLTAWSNVVANDLAVGVHRVLVHRDAGNDAIGTIPPGDYFLEASVAFARVVRDPRCVDVERASMYLSLGTITIAAN